MNLPNVRAICLQESPGREERLREHLSDAGIEWKRFEGISAARWGITTTETYELDNPRSGYIQERKHVGLNLSHYTLWTIQKELGLEEMTILEDDCIFDVDWRPRYTEARKHLPDDWHILLIGSGHSKHKPKTQISGDIWEVFWPVTTHAYIVRNTALDILLETQRQSGSPIDLSLIYRSYPLLNVYTILPRLAYQYQTPIDP